MPANTHQTRVQSDVQTSTLNKSATDSVGARARGFPARKGPSTVLGGDLVVSSIVVTPASQTLVAAATQQMKAVVKNAAGDTLNDAVTWNSATPAKATIDTSGLVTAVATGTSNVKASVGAVDSNIVVITVS